MTFLCRLFGHFWEYNGCVAYPGGCNGDIFVKCKKCGATAWKKVNAMLKKED